MKAPDVNTVDFETKGIMDRPDYPPVPVGVSIKRPQDKKPKYYAWGHPTGNNCTFKEAQKALREVWNSKLPLLFHHAKFDVDVAQTHMGMKDVKWDKVHDTTYLLFLNDPHAMSLALKPSAHKLLGMKPEEQDEVKEWVLEHKKEIELELGIKMKPSEWGAYIWMVPAPIVGKYANGDVTRTEKLFKYLWPIIVKDGMQGAYDRERKLMPIFLESEREGLRVDLPALRRDIPIYQQQLDKVEAWLRKRLKVKEINFDSDAEVAEALDSAGIVTDWELTKTGKRSTSKKFMTIDKFKDKKVFLALGYRGRLTTCLRMFMEDWLNRGEKSDGYIHPNWNQVRQPKGDDDTKGTRTGRPSCDNPNLLNLAKSFEDRGDDYTHPTFIGGLLPLPMVRSYILPDENCEWLHRDYNQQELRILAHFEDGELMDAYKKDPRMDVHSYIRGIVHQLLGKLFDRVSIKTTVFGRIYGQGLGGLAQKLKVSVDEVKEVRDAQNKALPGLPAIDKAIKENAKDGEPIVTWGGRVYYVEPPKYVEKFNREMTFEYKMLNYLVQGSAADATKEAIIRYWYSKKRKKTWRFLVTVYDEINICAPKAEKKEAMQLLKDCMESIELDVPLLTDGKIGKSWGALKGE